MPRLSDPLQAVAPHLVGRRWSIVPYGAFFDEWTPDVAYVFGYAFADGHMPRNRPQLVLYSKDESYLRRLAMAIGCEHLKLHRFGSLGSGVHGLVLGAARLADRVLTMGYPPGNKSRTMTFPEVPRPLIRHFIRGYFDDDGSVARHHRGQPRICFYSASRVFLTELSDRIADAGLGRRTPNERSDRSGEFYLLYGVVLTRGLREWLYAEGGIYDPRKRLAVWLDQQP
jgi:hypothetical protein